MTEITNITNTLSGLLPTDQVYESGGKFVKVRMRAINPPPGAESEGLGALFLEFSGSQANADGSTLWVNGATRISRVTPRVVQSDLPVGDLSTHLESLRLETVEEVLRAIAFEDEKIALGLIPS